MAEMEPARRIDDIQLMARVAAGVFMLLMGYRLIARFFNRPRSRRLAALFLGLSAGLGV